jgi:sortase (surface protein transpeptidase)
MDEEGSSGRPPVSIVPGEGPPTEPIPVISCRLDDWWDPAWDADWWAPFWGTVRSDRPAEPVSVTGKPTEAALPAAGTTKPGMRAGRPGVGLAMSPLGAVGPVAAGYGGSTPVPKAPHGGAASPEDSAEPSWGRVLLTTISLWASRRWPDVGVRWRGGSGRQGRTRFRWPSRPLRRASTTRTPRPAAWDTIGRGSHARQLAAAVLGAGVLAVCAGATGLVVASGSSASPVRLPARPSLVAVPSGRTANPAWLTTVQHTARPVWLTVPAIGVRAAVVNLGLNRNGTLQVPTSTTVVGWYTNSPRPGAIGSAVIAGHVDSRAGPAVFFWLRTMRRGERIYVKRADGTLAVFTVTSVRMYPKDKFPTAAVYGPVPDAELRLITCGGTFDESLGSYLSNVVVYARLIG